MEDDNRGAARAAHEAHEEVRHVGPPRNPRHGSPHHSAEIGDVQGPHRLRVAASAGAGGGENPEGTVAGSRRVESAGGSVHP